MQSIKSVSLTGFYEAYFTSIMVLLKPIERLANFEIRNLLLLSDLQRVKGPVLQLLTVVGWNFAEL